MNPLEIVAHIGLFGLQAGFVGLVILALFHVRRSIGLSPLYITLGTFQYLQVVLAYTVCFELVPGLVIYPGSTVLFTGNLFAALLVYIREDALEARKLIYGLVIANALVSVTSVLLGLQLLENPGVERPAFAKDLLLNNSRILMVGTAALLIDVVLIIVLYEAIQRRLPAHPLISVYVSMVVVLVLDTLLFTIGSFWGDPAFPQLVVSGIVGKAASAVVYAMMLVAYLLRFEPKYRGPSLAGIETVDVFRFLTYRQKYEALLRESQRDPLTGLLHRGVFDEALPRELHRAKRSGEPLSLLMIDIDQFKRINDEHGHQMGDNVLRCVATQMKARLRESDLACRIGGEEFAVVLPNTTLVQAMGVAETLLHQSRSACSGKMLRWPVDFAVTFTIGVAGYPEDADTADDLIRVADARLYAGKKAGRARVVGNCGSRALPLGHATH